MRTHLIHRGVDARGSAGRNAKDFNQQKRSYHQHKEFVQRYRHRAALNMQPQGHHMDCLRVLIKLSVTTCVSPTARI